MARRSPVILGMYSTWQVLGESGRDARGRRLVLARCLACGSEVMRDWYSIRVGKSTQCSCSWKTHGKSHGSNPTYISWQAMRTRCLNPKSSDYPNYGGRGITIAAEWDSFEQFLADMGARPAGMTLDRRDNDGNYCKTNCRWATAKEQRSNQRRRVYAKDSLL